MKAARVWGASLVLLAWLSSSCSQEHSPPKIEPTPASARTKEQAARSQNKVLVLGSSVAGGLASREAQAA
ncbi:MAG: hypothetical protein JXB05_11155, partial [Myxococcaceae bacterium]|nr:hypothetical protein [Myxococcaceae bacterium]